MNRLAQIFTIISILILISCNKKNDDSNELCGNNWSPSVELEEEIIALTDAAIAYSNDPTEENCNAYKQANLDYLDAIKDWEECYIYIGQQQEFNEAVQQAEADVNAIEC